MELTHYESAAKGTLPFDEECRAFAQKVLASSDPDQLLQERVSINIRRILDNHTGTQEELLRDLLPEGAKTWGYGHYLACELLRRQQGLYSLFLLTQEPLFRRVMELLVPEATTAQIAIAGHMQYHMSSHKLSGKQVYSVSPGLAERLRHTELRGLTSDDLKLEFPSIYLMVPPEADLKIWNVESGWHRVVGIYITEDKQDAFNGAGGWRFLVCGEHKPIELAPDIVDTNDALVFFGVGLPKGMPLTDALAVVQEAVVREAVEHSNDEFTPMQEKWQGIFRWAMNVVLYASMDSAEREEVFANPEAERLLKQCKALPKDSKKRKRLSSKLSSIQHYRRIVLGRSVPVHKEGWHLTVRVLVSGHWRNQPYGPGRMLRRLQWIEPFWRGPEEEHSDGALGGPGTLGGRTGEEDVSKSSGDCGKDASGVATEARPVDHPSDSGGERTEHSAA